MNEIDLLKRKIAILESVDKIRTGHIAQLEYRIQKGCDPSIDACLKLSRIDELYTEKARQLKMVNLELENIEWSLSSASYDRWLSETQYDQPRHYYEDAFNKLFDIARNEAIESVERQRKSQNNKRFFRRRPPLLRVKSKCQIYQKFQGCIPERVHDSIARANNDPFFKFQIFIITEAGPWTVETMGQSWERKTPTIRDRMNQFLDRTIDPLVIGWDHRFKQAFLIDSFDLSSVEETVRREFTEGEL